MAAEEHLAARGEPGDPAALTGRLFRDMTGALELLTVYLGERLGLYQALYADGPATSAELAGRTGTTERYIREWLEHHAASGLLEVDDPAAEPLARRYCLPPGHAPVLADTGDVRYQGFNGAEIVRAARWMPQVAEAVRSGGAPPPLPWAPEGRPEFMGDPDTAATGAMMRPATLRRYALEAGFRDLEVLPVKAGMLRFYRLTP